MITYYSYGDQYLCVETGQASDPVRLGIGDTAHEARDDMDSTPIQSAGPIGEASWRAIEWARGSGWLERDVPVVEVGS